MKTRLGVSAAAAFLCLVPLCSRTPPHMRAQLTCVVRNDTLTQAGVSRLVPGNLPPAQKMSRVALQCALSKQACTGSCTGQEREFFSDLSSQLGSQSGEAWTPEAAASLFRAAKVLRAKALQLPSAHQVGAYVDSVFASSVSRKDTGDGRHTFADDSVLGSMGSVATRQDLEKVIAEVFRVPLTTAGILADALESEEAQKRALSEASAYIKGLVSRESTRPRSDSRHAASQPLAHPQDNLKLALTYRSQKSIRDSIARHLPVLEALYKKQLKIHQLLSGTIWITFVINPERPRRVGTHQIDRYQRKRFSETVLRLYWNNAFFKDPRQRGAHDVRISF